jgi:hypothetical protein
MCALIYKRRVLLNVRNYDYNVSMSEAMPEPNKPSRRDFLKRAAGGAALALGGNSISGAESAELRRLNITPEYDREMKRLILGVHVDSRGLPMQDEDILTFVIRHAPPDSEIDVLVDGDHIVSAELWLRDIFKKRQNTSGAIRLHSARQLEPWAQDAFEPVSYKGKRLFLVSGSAKAVTSEKDRNAVRYANHSRVMREIYGEAVIDAPFYFEGGDMTPMRDKHGKSMILIGRTSYMQNLKILKSEMPKASLTEIQQEFKRRVKVIFPDHAILEVPPPSADELSETAIAQFKPDEFMFHLDQQVLPVADGVVAVATLRNTEDDEKRYGATIRNGLRKIGDQQLRMVEDMRSRGITVHEIEHSLRSLRDHSYALNCTFFARNGKRYAWVPIYGGDVEFTEANRGKDILEAVQPDTSAARTISFLKSKDFEVRGVFDRGADTTKGSIHCKINVAW